MSQWNYISLDVWGNEEDGWDVNAAYTTTEFIDIPDEATYKEVVELICQDNNIDTEELIISVEETDIYISDKRGMPVCQLRREE